MKEFKLTKFDQIGIVVKDIEKVRKLFGYLFDFKVKINVVEQKATAIYKGEEVTFTMRKIMQNFDGKQLEVVELLESTGRHLYHEFIQAGKTGLHHLGVYVKEAKKIINHFKNEFEIDVIQTGKAGRVKFYYLDTQEILGFYIELIAF